MVIVAPYTVPIRFAGNRKQHQHPFVNTLFQFVKGVMVDGLVETVFPVTFLCRGIYVRLPEFFAQLLLCHVQFALFERLLHSSLIGLTKQRPQKVHSRSAVLASFTRNITRGMHNRLKQLFSGIVIQLAGEVGGVSFELGGGGLEEIGVQ